MADDPNRPTSSHGRAIVGTVEHRRKIEIVTRQPRPRPSAGACPVEPAPKPKPLAPAEA